MAQKAEGRSATKAIGSTGADPQIASDVSVAVQKAVS